MPTNTTLRGAIKDIADAIRLKGVTGTMSLNQMPAKVATIPTGGGGKYGASMDSFLGDLDLNGALQKPNTTWDFDGTGIVSIPDLGFQFAFIYNDGIRNATFPDLTTLGDSSSGTQYTYPLRQAFARSSLVSISFPVLTDCTAYGIYQTAAYCDNLTSFSAPNLTTVGVSGLFNCAIYCPNLTTIDLDSLTTISGQYAMQLAFAYCSSLTRIELPSLTTISGNYGMTQTFQYDTSLEEVDFSNLTTISASFGMNGTFAFDTALKKVKMPKLSSITGTNGMAQTFSGCTALEEVDFSQATAIPTIIPASNANATFKNTNSTFKIIVPDALYNDWIADANWSSYAAQIVRLSEHQAT